MTLEQERDRASRNSEWAWDCADIAQTAGMRSNLPWVGVEAWYLWIALGQVWERRAEVLTGLLAVEGSAAFSEWGSGGEAPSGGCSVPEGTPPCLRQKGY